MATKKRLYYLPAYGQLGNQLATLAHLLAFAIEYNYLIIYPQSDYFSKHLQIAQTKQSLLRFSKLSARPAFAKSITKLMKLLFLNANKKIFQSLIVNKKFVVESEFDAGKQPRIIIVTDWLFRYYDGIKKHQDTLRRQLSFTASSVADAETKWMTWQEQYPQYTFIGIHVRRGDYAAWLGGKYFYDDATYYAWLIQMAKQTAKPVFIVCSNEDLHFDNPEHLTIMYAKGSPLQDLFLLSRCRYIIGPPSTFSSWAAFWGDTCLLQPETKEAEIQLDAFNNYYL